MKYFYMITLVLGIYFGIVMQAASIAVPRDASTAAMLSRSPDQWNISLEGDLKARCLRDLKPDIVVALKKRADFRMDIYKQLFLNGMIVIVMSGIGLFREWKMGKRKRTLASVT